MTPDKIIDISVYPRFLPGSEKPGYKLYGSVEKVYEILVG
jgi:hypothetical protein